MQRRHRSAHVKIWVILAIFLPIALLVATLIRQDGPIEQPAILLKAPIPKAQ